MQVNGVNTNGAQTQIDIKRPSVVTVKKDENLTIIAKRYGMSKSEFAKWTGLKGTIKVGQKITLPTAAVPAGKGIYALAREYNMTMAEFSKMNGIQDPQNYKAKAGEVFYVKTNTNSATTHSKKSNKNTTTTGVVKNSTQVSTQNTIADNKSKWGSSYSPKELGEKIYELSGKYYGAVGKPDFDALIKEINPKNVVAVISDYTSNSKNTKGESLINTITSEIKSNEQARKDAVMYIYDTLAKAKNAPAKKREEFVKELDKQFSKWVGMVDTENLDKMIQELLGTPSATSEPSVSTGQTISTPKPDTATNKKKVIVPGSKYPEQTIASLRNGAIVSGKREALKKFKNYCNDNGIKFDPSMLDLSPLERPPIPTVNGTSIVTTESEVLPPTGKANGKVIIVNAGHGGFSSKSGMFDPGSYSFIKKGNGKYAPLLEYEKMRLYADSTVEKLRAQGYSVVLTSGHAETFSKHQTFSKLVKNLNNGKKDGHKYDLKDMMLISLHADSEKDKQGSGVCFDPRFEDDKRLADIMNSNLNEAPWVKSNLVERDWTKYWIDEDGNKHTYGLQILHQTENIPSVLLEAEYVNGSRCQNLDSSAYQKQFVDKVVEGINEYFGIK